MCLRLDECLRGVELRRVIAAPLYVRAEGGARPERSTLRSWEEQSARLQSELDAVAGQEDVFCGEPMIDSINDTFPPPGGESGRGSRGGMWDIDG